MDRDEHQRERMRHWSRSYAAATLHACNPAWQGARDDFADLALAEFDKRFPAPAAVEVAKAPALTTMSLAVAETILAQEAELATLRIKARYWDAVRLGVIEIFRRSTGEWWATWANSGRTTDGYYSTAEEAVQAAIDAGALK